MELGSNPACDGGLTPHAETVVAGGMQWHYLVWGAQGRPAVLWHGITSDARGWWRLAPLLVQHGYQVFAPDLPGHGFSAAAPDGYTISNTAQLLDAWLDALHIAAPLILGHSWGGMNAVAHAGLPNARVRPRVLVLEDPALALANDPAPSVALYGRNVGEAPDMLHADLIKANPRWHPCDIWWKAQAHHRARRAAVEGFLIDNAGIDLSHTLGQLQAPICVILGDPAHGGIWRPRHIAALSQGAPHIQLDVIAGSTHNLHRDSFDGFSAALLRFLQRADASG